MERDDFSIRSRKARICAEVYSCTPNKEIRSLTLRLLKSALSGREQAYKLVINKDSSENLELRATSDRGLRMRKAAEASGPADLYVIPGRENPILEDLNLIAVDLEVGQRLTQSIVDWEARTLARDPINLNNDAEIDSAA